MTESQRWQEVLTGYRSFKPVEIETTNLSEEEVLQEALMIIQQERPCAPRSG